MSWKPTPPSPLLPKRCAIDQFVISLSCAVGFNTDQSPELFGGKKKEEVPPPSPQKKKKKSREYYKLCKTAETLCRERTAGGVRIPCILFTRMPGGVTESDSSLGCCVPCLFGAKSFLCWLTTADLPDFLLSMDFLNAVLAQWHVNDPGHSAKSAGGRLHLNTHTPLTQRSRSGLTMPLSWYSVGTYSGKRAHTQLVREYLAAVASAR